MRAALGCVATLCCCAMASEQTCRKVPFTLLGSGGVGAALLKAIVGARELHDTSYGLRFCAKAVCDSSGIAKATDGELSDEAIAAILAHKAGGGKLADLALSGVTITAKSADVATSAQAQADEEGGMLIDCTATGDTIPALLARVAAGGRVVSANKKPFASDYRLGLALGLGLGLIRVRFGSANPNPDPNPSPNPNQCVQGARPPRRRARHRPLRVVCRRGAAGDRGAPAHDRGGGPGLLDLGLLLGHPGLRHVGPAGGAALLRGGAHR